MAHFTYPLRASSRARSPFYKLLASLLIASFLLPVSALAQAAEPSANEGSTQPATSSTSGDTTSASTQDAQTTTPPADPQSGTLPDQASPTATDAVTKEKGDKGTPEDGDGTDSTFSITSESEGSVYDESRDPKGKKPKAEPDIQTGALNYSYPIKTPPGRNGLHPDIELRYSNQDGTTDNLFGYGWSTNIPYIERIIDRCINRFTFYKSNCAPAKND